MSKGTRNLMNNTNNKVYDPLCVLPPELFVSVLSLLTLKEAAASSILCRRWQHVWFLTRNLDFDGTDFILEALHQPVTLARQMERYVLWVEDILNASTASTVDRFRILFTPSNLHKQTIKRWVRFALSKKVEVLELNFPGSHVVFQSQWGDHWVDHHDEYYNTFPHELLRSSSTYDFTRLRKIITCYVDLNGEALEFFLRSCPLLDRISVTESRTLAALKVVGPLPNLKALEICSCHGLESVEIRDVGLTYLKCDGENTRDFVFQNVPRLVELHIGGKLTERMEDVRSIFSSCLPQLKMFTIDRQRVFRDYETRMIRLSSLRKLVVTGLCLDDGYDFLLPLTNFMRASPFLRTFVLKIPCHTPNMIKNKKISNKSVFTYPRLETIEFVGFRGGTSELEFVTPFLEHDVAPLLKKVIINTNNYDAPTVFWSPGQTESSVRATEEEMETVNLGGWATEEEMETVNPGGWTRHIRDYLKKRVPSRINLIVL